MKFYDIGYTVTARNAFTEEEITYKVIYQGDYDPTDPWDDPERQVAVWVYEDADAKLGHDFAWEITATRTHCLVE